MLSDLLLRRQDGTDVGLAPQSVPAELDRNTCHLRWLTSIVTQVRSVEYLVRLRWQELVDSSRLECGWRRGEDERLLIISASDKNAWTIPFARRSFPSRDRCVSLTRATSGFAGYPDAHRHRLEITPHTLAQPIYCSSLNLADGIVMLYPGCYRSRCTGYRHAQHSSKWRPGGRPI